MASNAPNPLSSSSLPSLMISAIPPAPSELVNSIASAPIPGPASAGKSNYSITSNIICRDTCENRVSSTIPAGEDQSHLPAQVPASTISAPVQSGIQFVSLPVEIHEIILDYIFGRRASAGNHTAYGESSAQNWSKALHHPRRKALANLALTCRVWTGLVQCRIYRHIRIKGSRDELANCARWFTRNPHLTPYVCHVEIWMPIWGDRALSPNISRSNVELHAAQPAARRAGHTQGNRPYRHHNHGDNVFHYQRPSNNASLEEIFGLGGHSKNSPMIQHFRHSHVMYSLQALIQRRLPVLERIQTFIMRGAWNLMRQLEDWHNISQALPSLSEWHCAWAQPHLNAYFIMIHILIHPPLTIRHINLSLEGFYNKSGSLLVGPSGPRNSLPPMCSLLGEAVPRLESFTYTGRVCWFFFETLKQGATAMRSHSRLRSLDLVVKACCHNKQVDKPHHWSQMGAGVGGITSIAFIRAFEAMVVKAIECLSVLPTLEYLRIRFIDLDSTCPPLNPYFQLVNNECTGLWSEDILEALRVNRPSASFISLADGITAEYNDQQIVGALVPRVRPLGIQVNTYSLLADSSNPY
ncbi:hypothetical protein N7519_006539 [Penicillium mononematosum]|uniref:uncharacterized protein n=1 Tax=Penicillium mononematosum TaxID=268346 RepID=UPI002546C498|nr:uncharacterized protein N7519_006539 [Penicillium mononematosum]KAJ6185238.1 hypothetical protein N7519_006539 [Penicillium mononematosum]